MIDDPESAITNPKSVMAAIVQGLERQIVVLDVVGSIPTSRPIYLIRSPSTRRHEPRFEESHDRRRQFLQIIRFY